MIGVQAFIISYCLVAQAADAPTIPPPGLSKRKFESPPAAGQHPGTGAHRPGHSAYEGAANPSATDRLLGDVDAAGGMAGDHLSELGQAGTGARRLRPPELLADALAGPYEGPLRAEPVPLVDALARSGDRETQRRIAVTYWRLSVAQAQLHFARANLHTLRRWNETRHKHSSLTESQLAAAGAADKEAEFRVMNEAEALGLLVGRADDDRILVTVDRPHVGDYRTKFERVFASRSPPPRLRLIHRTLPISRKAIDVHGEALVAAHDSLEATEEDYRQGKADYLTLAAALDRLIAAQSAFLAGVLRYNEDIAEYALFVAPGGFNANQLAKTLIIRPAPASRTRSEPPAESPQAEGGSFNTDSAERDPAHPTFRDEGPSGQETPADDSSASLRSRFRFRLIGFDEPAQASHGGDYQGLLQYEPGRQALELAKWLHFDRELPPDSGEKTTLSACMARVTSGQRRALIAAYWDTRQQMALYQVLSDRSSTLTALASRLLAMSGEPGGAAAMLRLRAARLAAQAAVLDQHIRLLSGQYELVQLLDTRPDQPWPLPAVAPHGDNYTVVGRDGRKHSTADAAGEKPAGHTEGAVALSLPATRVLVLHSELAERARALVFADEFRALHAPTQEKRPADIDGEMRAIDRQVRATDAFLSTLSNYNLAVADYVLPLLPPETPAKSLVGKLVVEEVPRTDT